MNKTEYEESAEQQDSADEQVDEDADQECPDPYKGLNKSNQRKRKLILLSYRFVRVSQRYLPFGIRSLLGLVLVAAGILGFLPILGFWMIPLGLALLATDIPPFRRRFLNWLNKRRRRLQHRRD